MGARGKAKRAEAAHVHYDSADHKGPERCTHESPFILLLRKYASITGVTWWVTPHRTGMARQRQLLHPGGVGVPAATPAPVLHVDSRRSHQHGVELVEG